MKPIFLSSFIVFGLLILFLNKRHGKMEEKFKKEFWDRENKANNTRKKSLDNLSYITIPMEQLPSEAMKGDPKADEYVTLLHDLSSQKIVNLTGITNTELKLTYGAANITCLSEYDQNYTLLARTLQQWAELLCGNGLKQEAQTVLEFAISTGTDVSHTYYLLADLYDEAGLSDKKAALIEAAGKLNTPFQKTIVRTLQGSGPYSGLLHSS